MVTLFAIPRPFLLGVEPPMIIDLNGLTIAI